MRCSTIILASFLFTGNCFAAEPINSPAVANNPAPVLAELPDSLHQRNADLIAQRRALSGEINKAYDAAEADFRDALPDLHVLKTEEGRKSVAPKAVKAIRTLAQAGIERSISGGNVQVSYGKPGLGYTFTETSQWQAGLLLVLGDEEGSAQLGKFARVNPETAKLVAQIVTSDAAGQAPVFSSLRERMKDEKDTVAFETTILTIRRKLAVDPNEGAALFASLKENAKSTMAKVTVNRLEAAAKAEVARGGVGSPLVIEGRKMDGTTFSTADWKGKVILIDFWATWCGPCKAELPRLKNLYKQYHAEGLEVLGVSNDYALKDLQKYVTADPDMPWPQLFDEASAAESTWHPVTRGFGIMGIPTMYVIDRKGTLRSVEARSELEKLLPELLAEKAE